MRVLEDRLGLRFSRHPCLGSSAARTARRRPTRAESARRTCMTVGARRQQERKGPDERALPDLDWLKVCQRRPSHEGPATERGCDEPTGRGQRPTLERGLARLSRWPAPENGRRVALGRSAAGGDGLAGRRLYELRHAGDLPPSYHPETGASAPMLWDARFTSDLRPPLSAADPPDQRSAGPRGGPRRAAVVQFCVMVTGP